MLITAAWVCHLLLAPALVTSQLLSPTTAVPNPAEGEPVTIRALEQEKDGFVYHLRGQVEIHYLSYVLYADEMTYNQQTGEVTAEGHVVLDGGPSDEHVEASRATYNLHTEVGRFEHVRGTTGIRLKGTGPLLTSSTPFTFTGKLVEKTGPDHYRVYDGTITTCELPHPKWTFSARKVVVEVGGNAKIYHSAFFIRGVPVLYLPFATHPIQKAPRQSGFLIPSVGRSSRKGTIVGESVYWAMNRSMDAQIGAEYYSMRGWSQRGEFRARPTDSSYIDLNYFGVLDRGIGNPKMDQGGRDIRLDSEGTFRHDFRAVANIDYLSSFVFRVAFNEIFSQAVYSEVKSQAFLSNTTRGYFYNASVQRYQNFESTAPGDVVTIFHAPSFESGGVDHKLGASPFYWSYDAAAEGLSRAEPGFSTGPLLGRFDLNPVVSLPLHVAGWSVRPDLSLRETWYTKELVPNSGVGTVSSDTVNRKALGTTIDIRPPALERVFAGEFMGRKWKHVIEPEVTYRYVTGVDNFPEILRFDYRDILSNTNEFEYGVVSRLYAKRTSAKADDCEAAGMPNLAIGRQTRQARVPWERESQPQAQPCSTDPQVREVLTWRIAQKYFFDPTFGGALVPGRRNVFTTSAELTGIAFLTDIRRFSPIVSRLRLEMAPQTDVEWDLDYDIKKGFINASTAIINHRVGPFTIGGGDAFLRSQGENLVSNELMPPLRFNQFRLLFGYGNATKRGFSAATNVGFDANVGFLQYSSVQTSYNWDCCGVTLEYRRFALGSVRNENQFRFNFALSNIGSFGNLRRQEKLY